MKNQAINHSAGTLSNLLAKQGINDLHGLLNYLRHLPYTRISDPQQLSLIVSEGRGTCSSKHAFLKSIAAEQGWRDVQLILCVYKMKPENTPGIGSSLQQHNLSYIPEAHCYVKYQGAAIDITRPGASIDHISDDILIETEIEVDQVGDWKKEYHRQYINDWREAENIKLSTDRLWKIREACIAALSS